MNVLPNFYACDLQFIRFYGDTQNVRKNRLEKQGIYYLYIARKHVYVKNLPERNIICHPWETRRRFVPREALR